MLNELISVINFYAHQLNVAVKNKLVSATMSFVQEDRVLSWYYFLSTLLLVIIAFLGTYWIPFTAGKVISGLLAGLLTSRLFVLYHDFHHEAILRKTSIAKFLMRIVGVLTLTPATIWDETHQHHHTHNSKFSRVVLGSFPTISTREYAMSGRVHRFRYLLIRHPLMILFAYVSVFLVSFCLWPFFENPKKYYDCGIAATVHACMCYALYNLGGWPVLFYSLLLPCIIMFALGAYIFYAQHNFPSVVLKDDAEWDYVEAALHSSSFIKMNRVMRWFTANIGYHHVHHVNSRIPFYRLPEVMDKLVELRDPALTSLHPKEIWKCLQLKLWDQNLSRMISLQEFKKIYPDTHKRNSSKPE